MIDRRDDNVAVELHADHLGIESDDEAVNSAADATAIHGHLVRHRMFQKLRQVRHQIRDGPAPTK